MKLYTISPNDFSWNPSDEALDYVRENVQNDEFEPIVAAGFRRPGLAWFIQFATDDFNYWLGYFDEAHPDYVTREGFNEAKDIRRSFSTAVQL